MSLIIYLIAFLEWFTTLSVEIVALRIFTPIIWSNSISTSIILWIILLALSYWYYIWWKLSLNKEKIPKKLVTNLIISSSYYFFITFIFSSSILEFLLWITWSYFLWILLTSIILFFIPVFLASQTIPLLAELLKWTNVWEKIWKLLFYSTIWSFVWSVWTSSILFLYLWVFKTWILSSILLSFSALIISIFFIKKEKSILTISIFFIFFLFFIITYSQANNVIYSKSNAYHNIIIYNWENNRYFTLDWLYSSWIDLNTKNSSFKYINETINKVREIKPKNVLVIWAAWFTFPNDISEFEYIENIDVVDIDSSLKKISEEYFLQKTLSKKINFYTQPTRFFLNNIDSKKYDFILIDAYSWKSPPSQLLTLEFFEDLKKVWDNIYINIIMDSEIKSDFSNNLFSTINKAFGESYYIDVNLKESWLTNIIVTNNYSENYIKNNKNKNIYTDDKNSIELDIFKMYSK